MICYIVYCVNPRQWKSEQYDQIPFGQPVRCLKYEKTAYMICPPYNQNNVLIFFKRQELNYAFETYKLTLCIHNMNCLDG